MCWCALRGWNRVPALRISSRPPWFPRTPAAIALGLLLERLQQAAPLRFASATMLAPASEFGRGAMDELHQQTVSLLSFQAIPRAVYDAQAAYNLLSGFGESAKTSLSGLETRILRHYEALGGGRWPLLGLQAIAAPVFHGHTFSISVELERPLAIPLIEDALSGDHVEMVLEDTDSPSNLAATGQNGVLVRLRPVQDGRNPSQASRSGCGRRRTTCGFMRRTPSNAPWNCASCGRRERCSKPYPASVQICRPGPFNRVHTCSMKLSVIPAM